jgi:hypothetical protein
MDVHPARPATHDDVDDVAALAAGRREDYELQQPRFWRQAEDALTRHELPARADRRAGAHLPRDR